MNTFTKILVMYEDQCFNMGLIDFGGKYDHLNYLNNYFLSWFVNITMELRFPSKQIFDRTAHVVPLFYMDSVSRSACDSTNN